MISIHMVLQMGLHFILLNPEEVGVEDQTNTWPLAHRRPSQWAQGLLPPAKNVGRDNSAARQSFTAGAVWEKYDLKTLVDAYSHLPLPCQPPSGSSLPAAATLLWCAHSCQPPALPSFNTQIKFYRVGKTFLPSLQTPKSKSTTTYIVP